MKRLLAAILSMLLLHCCVPAIGQTAKQKPRTIITTDGEIDDVDSFIRLLLYANELQIEGLVYSSSMWHYKGDGKGTRFTSEMEMTRKMYGEKTDLRWPGVHWMEELIDAYAIVYPSLKSNSAGYPSPARLRSLIKVGNIDFEGEMEKITAGSELIKSRLLDKNPAPLFLQAWGGVNTIGRALKSIEEQFKGKPGWSQLYRTISSKTTIFIIMDQDAVYREYVSQHWPDIRIIYNAGQFGCLAYPWQRLVPKELYWVLEGDFMRSRIIQDHGALLKKYYSYGDGQKQEGDPDHTHGDLSKIKNFQWGSFNQYDFISEGDSPAYLFLLDVGLNNLHHPDYGGWGGRYLLVDPALHKWQDNADVAELNPYTQKPDADYPQTRWLEAMQMDFAARADWCVKPFKQANHPPSVKIAQGEKIKAAAGSKLQLIGSANDPDGNSVKYHWWVYREAGSCKQEVTIADAEKPLATLELPANMKKGETIHAILEVTDSGSPALTRYRRIVIECK